MERVDICDGWSIEFSAPTLRILKGGTAVFESHEWNPNFSDPLEDALEWASAVASPDSGLTVEADDDPDFATSVLYVRKNAPSHFADECAFMAEDRRNEIERIED